eukprot:Unigene4714_Nuclearia_a/m.14401 Unigene4714_Nuclearia_a/g.14401  ORF Unigene4714_Nuclearia_a/g.14401 Unigene4714_Nuclearia_a/m.14401 type:complete len:320 (+) Unigene4714_Nuclearia_a:32-991(+)
MLASALHETLPAASVTTLRVPVADTALADSARHELAVTVLRTDPGSTSARPVVLLLHGIGDTAATFRFLAPRLVREGGHDVVAPDLRGCGASSAAFAAYAPERAGADVFAVLDACAVALGGDVAQRGVVIVAHSYSAASAVWAAAERPALVRGLVLMGPFVRDPNEGRGLSLGLRLLLSVLFAWPWGAAMWESYYAGTLHKAPDLDRAELARHAAAIRASLDLAHLHALQQMVFATKAACTARLPEVRAPSLTVIGGADPDYPVPENEAKYIVDALAHTGDAKYEVLEQVGHYPFFEVHSRAGELVLQFLASHGAAPPA